MKMSIADIFNHLSCYKYIVSILFIYFLNNIDDVTPFFLKINFIIVFIVFVKLHQSGESSKTTKKNNPVIFINC